MSLDVYLHQPGNSQQREPEIWIREDGQQRTITREEWDQENPGREPVTLTHEDTTDLVYHANITHNLGRMAEAAGLYRPLWRPEEAGWTRGRDLIEPLRAGIQALESDPNAFEQYNPANGWGTYEALLGFSRRYLRACETWPDATIGVSR